MRRPEDPLTFYYRAAMLGRVYRFMTEQRLFHGGFPMERAAAHRLLPRHLRPLHPVPQGHRPGHPGPGVRGAAGHRRIFLVQADPALPHPPPHRGHVRGRRVPCPHLSRGLPGEHRQSREPPPPAGGLSRAAGVHRGGQRRGGPRLVLPEAPGAGLHPQLRPCDLPPGRSGRAGGLRLHHGAGWWS